MRVVVSRAIVFIKNIPSTYFVGVVFIQSLQIICELYTVIIIVMYIF